MSRLRVGLLSNPTSAGGVGHRSGRAVAHLLRVAGLSVVDISGPSAGVALARGMDVRDTLSALVVVGGDGTVALGAELVAGTHIGLGIVPSGSGNDFARAMQIPRNNIPAAVTTILEALSAPPVMIDTMRVEGRLADGTPVDKVAVGNVNLGFDAVVNARANRRGKRASSGYTTSVLAEIVRYRPYPFWYSIDGGPRIDSRASILTLCNTGMIGGGMNLSPRSSPHDGTLELLDVSGLSAAGLLAFFPRVFRGSHIDLPYISVRSAQRVTVGVREPVSFLAHADGDALSGFPLTVSVMPGAVRLLASTLPLAQEN